MTKLTERRAEVIEDARAAGMSVQHVSGPHALITVNENGPHLSAEGFDRAILVQILRGFADELERQGVGHPRDAQNVGNYLPQSHAHLPGKPVRPPDTSDRSGDTP